MAEENNQYPPTSLDLFNYCKTNNIDQVIVYYSMDHPNHEQIYSSAFIKSIKHGSMDCISFFLNKDIPFNDKYNRPLELAIRTNNEWLVEQLLLKPSVVQDISGWMLIDFFEDNEAYKKFISCEEIQKCMDIKYFNLPGENLNFYKVLVNSGKVTTDCIRNWLMGLIDKGFYNEEYPNLVDLNIIIYLAKHVDYIVWDSTILGPSLLYRIFKNYINFRPYCDHAMYSKKETLSIVFDSKFNHIYQQTMIIIDAVDHIYNCWRIPREIMMQVVYIMNHKLFVYLKAIYWW